VATAGTCHRHLHSKFAKSPPERLISDRAEILLPHMPQWLRLQNVQVARQASSCPTTDDRLEFKMRQNESCGHSVVLIQNGFSNVFKIYTDHRIPRERWLVLIPPILYSIPESVDRVRALVRTAAEFFAACRASVANGPHATVHGELGHALCRHLCGTSYVELGIAEIVGVRRITSAVASSHTDYEGS
jgi:hypothetical protein